MVNFGVLGSLTAADERGPIQLKGPRHRAVLARLLVARGRVVPVSWLIGDLWEEPGEGALGAVQTFVGALRKALEPSRPPRTPSRLLITSPPGYALRADPGTVDAWRFESALASSAHLPAEEARVLLDEALGLWRGPAYAEFADHDWARGEASRLDELRLLAVERRASALLGSGLAAESVPDLEAHVFAHPLREDGWRLLALALYRAGRQGDALATLRRAREVLAAELGLDPGSALRRLESDILTHAPHLTAPAEQLPDHRPTPHLAEGDDGASAATRPAEPGERPFVGRVGELAELEGVAADVASAGRSRLVLVSGVAGAGKTALARTLARRLEAGGWAIAWGASPELQGAPAAWPWTQMREQLAAAGRPITAPDGTDAWATGDAPTLGGADGGDALGGRFRRHRVIAAQLAAVAAQGPVLLVFDDLHWADEETLGLLTTPAAGLGPVLVVGTYRSTEISTGLAEALGRAARVEPARVYLGGLTQPQVRELVQAVGGREISADEARTIHVRSAGNPFFVRELIRVWESEGEAGLHTVPAGVRDVIRHRLAALPDAARTHLRQAAVIGQEVDLDVLIPLAGDEEQVLDSVESALLAGFLVERDADRLRFAHALVHETLYDDVTRSRRARWHARVAELVERARPGDVETIAHHYVRAEGRADATRTAHYTRAAAERAERRSAPHEAARLWRETIAALDRAKATASPHAAGSPPATDASARVEAVMGLVRALAVTGGLRESRECRAEAVGAAEALGDPVLTASVIGSFDVPAIWTTNDDPALSARLVAAAERTLAALPPGHDPERARLLITIAMERRADAGGRGAEAAREAEVIARRLDDRTLLAYALNGRYMQTFHRAGLARQRAAIGEELLGLAAAQGRGPAPHRRDGLVTFEVLGHLILIQARAALADLEAADRHAAAADRLADRYDLPLVGVFTTWYAALRRAVTGESGARAAYRTAAARLSGTGMPGVEDGILPLALLCLEVADTRWEPPGKDRDPADMACDPTPVAGSARAGWGPYERWARPLALLAQGRREEASAAAQAIPDSPRDLLFEARTCLHAMVAIETADRPAMERLYDRLLPAEDELAGAGSGLLTLGPVARHLGRLATALGRHREAEGHFRQAAALTARARAVKAATDRPPPKPAQTATDQPRPKPAQTAADRPPPVH
ncbi:BTAD domain-containing putative transcriptional regulator [Nonomuraea insulae]|uniref:BTAD domain-containing putative transcriptional regulator n=1 Tax=Nonomuraea insulae TaxID=1616787 RepID=A0ABW1CTW3_9ACTN